LDIEKNIHLQVRAGLLLSSRWGVESLSNIVVIGAADFLDAIATDVVVGEQKSFGRDEGARTAVIEADRRLLDVLQKLVGDFESVLLLNRLSRELVHRPHSFIRQTKQSGRDGQ